eukprot:scaffold2799_cov408-Prasinococcus_capsulatus_cf.AAC.6
MAGAPFPRRPGWERGGASQILAGVRSHNAEPRPPCGRSHAPVRRGRPPLGVGSLAGPWSGTDCAARAAWWSQNGRGLRSSRPSITRSFGTRTLLQLMAGSHGSTGAMQGSYSMGG